MTSTHTTGKKPETGDNTTITATYTATIPAAGTLSATLYEDVGQTGTADNSNTQTLSSGTDNTVDFTGFDGGGSTNDYWVEFSLDGDGTDPTVAASTVDSFDVAADSAGGGGGAGSAISSTNGVLESTDGVLDTQ